MAGPPERPLATKGPGTRSEAAPRTVGGETEDFRPYIPHTTTLPEMTIKVFVVGIILAWIMSAANAYLGMFAALTVSAAIPASVISMAVFRLFKERNILENNLVQTTASAGESVTAGIIFSLPALLFLGYWSQIGIVETMIIAALGGSLGVLFTIPLRRAFIVDAKLQYPEGVAAVEVLKSGEKGATGVGYILTAGLVGGLYKFLQSGFGLWGEVAATATRLGNSGAYFALNMSPALIGIGFIIGIRIAALIFAGGVMGYVIASPLYLAFNDWPLYPSGHAFAGTEMTALDAFADVRANYVRFIGVGGMAAGGVYTLYRLRHALVRGIQSGLDAYRAMKTAGSDTRVRTERDMNMKTVLIAVLLFAIPLTALFGYFVTNKFEDMDKFWIAPILGVVMLGAGFLFSAVAGYMAGVVGSSNNPISGTGIGTLIVTALLLVGFGIGGDVGPAAAILIAGTIMSAAAIAGDNMQDLKAGYLLGGTPRNLQIMQIVGAVAAALSLPFVLLLLNEAYTIGSPKLSAPQADLMGSIATGIFGGALPWDAFWIGVGVAAAIIAADNYLEFKGSSFRMPVLAVAIGIYLPWELATPIFLGGLVAWLAGRSFRRQVEEVHGAATSAQRDAMVERRVNRGVLFASGLIAGEALLGILIAGLLVYGANTGDPDVNNPIAFSEEPHWFAEGLLVVAFIVFLMYYATMRGHARDEEPPPVESLSGQPGTGRGH